MASSCRRSVTRMTFSTSGKLLQQLLIDAGGAALCAQHRGLGALGDVDLHPAGLHSLDGLLELLGGKIGFHNNDHQPVFLPFCVPAGIRRGQKNRGHPFWAAAVWMLPVSPVVLLRGRDIAPTGRSWAGKETAHKIAVIAVSIADGETHDGCPPLLVLYAL